MKGTKSKRGAKMDRKEPLKPVAEDRKRKAVVKEPKSSKKRVTRGKGAHKDPNKPKRPPSAFFVFLEEFRKVYKEEHPNVKAVSAVGKAGGQKWKSMSKDEKAPYEAKAAKRKSEYEKLMKAYNNKEESLDGEDDNEVSDKSKSEVSDEDEESEEESEEDDEDDD